MKLMAKYEAGEIFELFQWHSSCSETVLKTSEICSVRCSRCALLTRSRILHADRNDLRWHRRNARSPPNRGLPGGAGLSRRGHPRHRHHRWQQSDRRSDLSTNWSVRRRRRHCRWVCQMNATLSLYRDVGLNACLATIRVLLRSQVMRLRLERRFRKCRVFCLQKKDSLLRMIIASQRNSQTPMKTPTKEQHHKCCLWIFQHCLV